MHFSRLPLPGAIIGYALAIVVAAVAARIVWELLQAILPVLITVIALAGIYWLIFGGLRR